jgi:hypothetical protein
VADHPLHDLGVVAPPSEYLGVDPKVRVLEIREDRHCLEGEKMQENKMEKSFINP